MAAPSSSSLASSGSISNSSNLYETKLVVEYKLKRVEDAFSDKKKSRTTIDVNKTTSLVLNDLLALDIPVASPNSKLRKRVEVQFESRSAVIRWPELRDYSVSANLNRDCG